ncbi:MAG TPA: (2Fe-2S)-binding protein [Polyangia bacterium]|nr:(2Fe-2S)-binding protein [Polyangia bacterium]
MLVCHCHQICDRTICESIRGGASSVEEVGRACGAGTGCGGCRPRIGRLLARVEAETDTPPSLIAVAALSYRLAS